MEEEIHDPEIDCTLFFFGGDFKADRGLMNLVKTWLHKNDFVDIMDDETCVRLLARHYNTLEKHGLFDYNHTNTDVIEMMKADLKKMIEMDVDWEKIK